ncbi:MAG: DNA topoisomerase 3 [Bacteroidales bacterium]|nr:DNA topoisomerase 3 [Bacteroidales bacterium]
MKVCITEKPSVARDIARILGASKSHEGYFEGNGYQVTWALGHLCCLKAPDDYNAAWKAWKMESLPMFPERFSIKLIDNAAAKKQFKIVKSLFLKADCIINCGDAGQEGELIQRWILQMSNAKCPVQRLWISSLTDEAIKEGFRNLKPQRDYDNLYLAGLARACGDWLLGMNATRLFSLKYSNSQVLSIGRVQTPTLALIVQRQDEIDNFKPEKFFVLSTTYRDVSFKCDRKFPSREECEKALLSVKGRAFRINDIEKKDGTEQPPQLYDLTSLQVDCNNKLGWSAEYTLNTLQTLYEKKLTSYPRVDSRYLPDDMYPKCESILRGIGNVKPISTAVLSGPLRKSKRVFDSSKVTDHHAIIPTGVTPRDLNLQQAKLYDLVARRFICVFFPNCSFQSTKVTGSADNSTLPFVASGKTIVNPGWRAVYGKVEEGEQKDGQDNAVLPVFKVGEYGSHSPKCEEKTTQPPKPYTEATLLRAMETAGKLIENDAIRDAMKENGIGRPSSRAAIIETLFKRNYIFREKKNLVPTPTGIDLIATIKFELLKSCELTGIWEKKLRDIEKGKYDSRNFIAELKDMLRSLVKEVKGDASGHRIMVSAGNPSKPRAKYTKRKRK